MQLVKSTEKDIMNIHIREEKLDITMELITNQLLMDQMEKRLTVLKN